MDGVAYILEFFTNIFVTHLFLSNIMYLCTPSITMVTTAIKLFFVCLAMWIGCNITITSIYSNFLRDIYQDYVLE